MLEIQVAVVLCVFAFLCGAALAWTLQEKKHSNALRGVTASMTSKVRDRMDSFEQLETQVKTLLGSLNQMEGAFARQMGIQTRFMKRLSLNGAATAAAATRNSSFEDDLCVLDMDNEDSPTTEAAQRSKQGEVAEGIGSLHEVIASWEDRCKSMQAGQFAELERLRKIIQNQAVQISELMGGASPAAIPQAALDLPVERQQVETVSAESSVAGVEEATAIVPNLFDQWNDEETDKAVSLLDEPEVLTPNTDEETQDAFVAVASTGTNQFEQVAPPHHTTEPSMKPSSNASNTEFRTAFDQRWIESLAEMSNQEKTYAKLHEQLANASSQREQQLHRLEQRVADLHALESKLQNALREGSTLRDRCAGYESEIAQRKQEIETLCNQLTQSQEDLRQSEDQALQWQEESEAKLKALESDLAERTESCQGLERSLEARGREMDELHGRWKDLRQQREDQDRRLANLQSDLETRNEEVEQLQGQVKGLERELAGARDAIHSKSSQLSTLMQSLETTQADVEQQRKAAAAKDSHLQSAASVLGRLRPLIEALEGELASEAKDKELA